jgi:serine/threonine protein kinase
MPLQPGSFLNNRYRIEDKLGRGGMGAVYLAHDQTLNIRVAVKENLNANPEAERQFKKEAELLAKLRHPHLARVTDYFILQDQQYLVMDYVEGIDLHARAAQSPPTVAEVLRWASDLGSALTYLHSRPQPIIHRDIKPANVKVQPDGTLFLVDFGIAKIFEHDQAATTTGARGLTPGYSPPEQYGGARTDARSDQYALAATLYSLMTHVSPPDSIERMLNKETVAGQFDRTFRRTPTPRSSGDVRRYEDCSRHRHLPPPCAATWRWRPGPRRDRLPPALARAAWPSHRSWEIESGCWPGGVGCSRLIPGAGGNRLSASSPATSPGWHWNQITSRLGRSPVTQRPYPRPKRRRRRPSPPLRHRCSAGADASCLSATGPTGASCSCGP